MIRAIVHQGSIGHSIEYFAVVAGPDVDRRFFFEQINVPRGDVVRYFGGGNEIVLNPEGVLVMQVILGEHHFHPQYEQVIHDKKLAEQNADRLRSEGRAAAEQSKSNLQKAMGTVAQQLAQANGHLEQVKLQADADFFQNQKRAEAILAEKRARAKAIQKENEALAGAGGKTMVKLRLAEALAGKQLLFVPTGKGGVGLQTLNLNQLLGIYAGSQALEGAGASAEPEAVNRKAK